METKPNFKRKLLAAGISSCLLSSAGTAFAQEQIEEEMIVRGIKSSLERSLDIKREANQIVEAITADDIGKMPDQNIAESLQRLPGIQIDRRDGQGTKVRIRGLDQNKTLLNGEQFTSGLEYFQMGEWRQEFNSSLEGVPSELLGGVEVYKSPVASLVEGGLGGTIDLKTRSAFDLNEMLVAANVKIDQGMDSSDAKPSAFLVLGNNWDDTFGAIASVSYSAKTVHTDYIQNFSRESTQVMNVWSDGAGYLYDPTNGNSTMSSNVLITDPTDGSYVDITDPEFNADYAAMITRARAADANGTLNTSAHNYIAPGMFYVMDTEQSRERIGGSVNLQWRPTEALELGLDWFYNKNTIENTSYTVKHPMATDNAAGLDLSQPFDIDESNEYGVLQSGTIQTPGTETNTAGEVTDTTASNIAIDVAYDNGGKLRFTGLFTKTNSELEGRAGYADSRFSEYGMRAFVGAENSVTGWDGTTVNPSPGGDSARFYHYSAGTRPSLAYDNSEWLSNPDYHTYKSHWGLGTDVESDTWSARADFELDMDLGHLKVIKFGARLAEEETTFDELRYMTDFSTTTGAQSPTLYNSDGSVASATTFNPATAPDATNAGVQEAVYYDLCGNGGIPAGVVCDINQDGRDDNQPYGPNGYFLDAAIGLKAFDLTETLYATDLDGNPTPGYDDAWGALAVDGDGNPLEVDGVQYRTRHMGVSLYGESVRDSGRWNRSPGYLPWQTYTPQSTVLGAAGDESRYIVKKDFFRSGGYSNSTVAFQNGDAITADPEAWIASIAPNSQGQYMQVPLESWTVKQSTTAFYGEADLEGDSVPYTLNVGVRLVGTEVDVTSAVTTPDSANWSLATDGWNSQGVLLTWDTVTETKTYWDILPSMNFSLDATDDVKLRFTAAKVLSRPSLQDMGKGFGKNFTRTDSPYTYFQFTGGSSGNPDLEPYRATQADAAVEYYFDELGYLSGGVFVKSIKSFIGGATVEVWGADAGPGGGRVGNVNTVQNGSGGSVSGFELALQQSWENGWGASANYTYSANTADISTTINPGAGLPGVSENAFNLIGFYENEVISARVAYTWRDEFVSPDRSAFSVSGLPEGATEYFDAYGQFDANITWDVLDNLSLTAEAINITGEAQSSYLGYPNQPMSYASQEPRVVMGLNFRM